MVRRLYLLRHAKTEAEHKDGDFYRELAHKADIECEKMRHYLVEHKFEPEVAVVSNAVRALGTINKLGLDNIVVEPRLYNASEKTILGVVKEINNTYSEAILVGHNPNISRIAFDFLLDRDKVLLMELGTTIPTCGLVIINFSVQDWADVVINSGQLEDTFYP